ncbi:MAG: hypothetical protein M3063_14490 [Actinomycetota bacterium]|nr:hypothetical protein [Actinomycetota bacterium]
MTDDRFKRYQDAGNEFLETARARAEDFLRELAKATESTQKQAQGQVDDLVAAGRRSTDQMIDVVRREVEAQLGQLGLATKSDLEALERRLGGTPPKRAATTKTAAHKAPAQKARAATRAAPSPAKKASATKSPAKKAPARKAPAKKAAAAVKKATGTSSN